MSSWQAMVISGLPKCQAMYSTKRVLPQPVGPLSIIGMPYGVGRLVQRDFVARRRDNKAPPGSDAG